MKSVLPALVLILSACGAAVDAACDRAALDAVSGEGSDAARAVLAACPGLDPGVARRLQGQSIEAVELGAGLWDCSVTPGEAQRDPLQAWAACDLADELGGEDPGVLRFAFAEGEPIGGVLLTRWLIAKGYPREAAQGLGRRVIRFLPDAVTPVELAADAGTAPARLATTTLVVDPDGVHLPDGSQAGPVGTERLAVLPLSGTSASALGALVRDAAGRVPALDLIAQTPDGSPRALQVQPASSDLGVALAGAVEVHLHEHGLMIRHGTTLRTTEPVSLEGLGQRIAPLIEQDVPGRTLRLVPHDVPVDDVLAAVQVLDGYGTVHLTPGDAACGPAPAGMVCVPGTSLPADGGYRVISPFLVEVSKASLADYESCVEAGGCRRTERRGSGPQTLTELSWEEALRYCVWSGKTLPTPWQWETAHAGGHLEDPGDGPSEWTRGGLTESCGDACLGIDPVGPCGGAEDCEAAPMRVVRGGAEPVPGSPPGAEAHGVRCVQPWPVQTMPDKPTLGTLAPPSEEQLEAFQGSPEDPIELKPLCDGVGGQAHLDCKDPVTYIIGNEPRAHLFMEHLAGLGGGYVGVAADQNYSQAAIAKTEWLWLMDYDPKVVSVHRMNGALIRASDTPEAFVDWYRPARRAEAQRFVREQLGDDELTELALRNLRVWGDRLHEHYTRSLGPPEGREGIDGRYVPAGRPEFGWLRNPAHYQHIRTLWQQGRVRAVKGDMLGEQGMQGIGRAARAMGVPIRVYYTSNAPYAWGGMMVEAYRRNVRALPMDEHSILVHTLGSPTGFGQRTYWHHNVMRGTLAQERLGHIGFDHVSKLVYDRAYGGDPDLTVVGVPARLD